jgi:hypothetical protein
VLLWKEYGIVYVSVYIAIASVITLLSVLTLLETKGSDIHKVHDDD